MTALGGGDDEATTAIEQPAGAACDRPTVADLVQRAARGEQAAWDTLVEQFAGMVWAVARSYRLNEADASDVSQTTWLRLVEHLDRIDRPERVAAWLATTARREALRVLRMTGRQVPTGEDFDMLPDPMPNASVARQLLVEEQAQVLAELVSRLSCRCQLLLRLLNSDTPLSYEEVSEMLGLAVGSIGPTRGRCLEHLRRLALREGLSLSDVLP